MIASRPTIHIRAVGVEGPWRAAGGPQHRSTDQRDRTVIAQRLVSALARTLIS
jgi:hypothetical protein